MLKTNAKRIMNEIECLADDETMNSTTQWRHHVAAVYWKDLSNATMPEMTVAQMRTGRDTDSVDAALHKSLEQQVVFTEPTVDAVHDPAHEDKYVVDPPVVVATFCKRKTNCVLHHISWPEIALFLLNTTLIWS